MKENIYILTLYKEVSLDESERGEWKSWLKAQKTKITQNFHFLKYTTHRVVQTSLIEFLKKIQSFNNGL